MHLLAHPALVVLSALVMAPFTNAQLVAVGPFSGTYHEEFRSASYSSCVPQRLFHGRADLCTPGRNGLMVTFAWMQYVGYTMYPHNGSAWFAGTTQGTAHLTLDVPAQRVGGYFGTVGYLAGGVAKLYGSSDQLLGTLPMAAPRGGWAWNGWDAGNGPKIARIELIANDPYNGGSMICMDELEYSPALPIEFFGSACEGEDGPPDFRVTGTVGLGNTITFSVTNTAASGQVLYAGFSSTTWAGQPLPFDLVLIGAPGCTILTSLDLQVAGGPVAPVTVPIPNSPQLLGLRSYWQALLLGDPNLVSVVTTNAVAITLL